MLTDALGDITIHGKGGGGGGGDDSRGIFGVS